MRFAVMLSLLAFAACRSAGAPEPGPTHAETPPPITATPPTASPPSATPPPTTGTETPPAVAPPLLHPPEGRPPEGRDTGGGGGATAGCQKDSDCALTYAPDEGCCATMCAPKGVTAAEAQKRDQRVKDCEQKRGHPCPAPACRARAFRAACVSGACTAALADDR